MAKRMVAKTGEYQKDGQTKGRYTEIGIILSNDKGEFMLLDPAINLAGILLQQNILAANGSGRVSDKVMVSVFDNDNNQRGGNSGGSQGGGGYDSGSGGGYGAGGGPSSGGRSDMDDEIPFAPEFRA